MASARPFHLTNARRRGVKLRIIVGDPAHPDAIIKRRHESSVPAVGDLVEFRTDHDERRWVAVVTGRLFNCLPNETIVDVFAEQEGR